MIVCQKPANIGRSIYYARCAHPVDARNVREYHVATTPPRSSKNISVSSLHHCSRIRFDRGEESFVARTRLQPLPPFSPSSPEFLIHPRRMVGEEIEKLVARSKGGRSFLIVDFTGWMMKRRDEYPRRGDTTVSFFPSCNQKIRCYLSEVIASLKIYHRICVTATFCADDVIKGSGERRAQEEGVEM